MNCQMKADPLPNPNLSQIILGGHLPPPAFDSAPACISEGGDIPYGCLLGGEDEKFQIIFTDSVRHLYLPDAKLD